MIPEIFDCTKIKRSPHTTFTIVDNEAFVLTEEDAVLHNLNEVGAKIWELLEEPKTVRDIVERVCDEYSVGEKQLQNDVVEFIHELVDKKLVTIS